MKVKMLTISAGPDPTLNWSEGDIRNVGIDEARMLERQGVAKVLEPYPADSEKPVVGPAEKAVIGPSEIAGKGKVGVGPQKQVVQPPASSDAEILAKIAACKTTADLLAFRVEGRSQVVEDALNAKGNELHASEQKTWGKK